MLVVCHVVGGGVLFSEDAWPQMPLILTALFWLTVTVVVSLLLLPRMKGAVVGQQWALCMHGFGGGDEHDVTRPDGSDRRCARATRRRSSSSIAPGARRRC